MNRSAFYESLRRRESGVFGTSLSQGQVDGCETIMAASDGLPVDWRAYILATAYHETACTMQPVRETMLSTDAKAVNALERAWKAGRLGQVRTPYWRFDDQGKSWLGRGYVQLTHRDNYQKAAALTDVDLLGDPSKAMIPAVAVKILVEGMRVGLFTGKKLADFVTGDYRGMRRIVNGTDKADTIAGYARAFEAALQAAGASEATTQPKEATSPSSAKKPGSGGILWGSLAAAVALGLAYVGEALCKVPLVAWIFSICGG